MPEPHLNTWTRWTEPLLARHSKGSNLSRVRSEQLANPKTDCREILGLFSF